MTAALPTPTPRQGHPHRRQPSSVALQAPCTSPLGWTGSAVRRSPSPRGPELEDASSVPPTDLRRPGRLSWTDVPEQVRQAVIDAIGAPIVSVRTPPGGFTPGVVARVLLADGRRCFVKAASAVHGDWVATAYRHEASVNAHLPRTIPAPRMWVHLDVSDWVCLVFDD